MLTVAYLANQFPAAVEPYVWQEIQALRRRGIKVLASSARKPILTPGLPPEAHLDLCIQSVRWRLIPSALLLMAQGWRQILLFLSRILLRGDESLPHRAKALLHTALGAYYAALLKDRGGVDHIHVHHGYFSAWIAMVAARLLKIDFSLTLHGSDLLLHGVYLDTKLENCSLCFTVSEYNRQYILRQFRLDPEKVILARLGVDPPAHLPPKQNELSSERPFTLLAAGRLHPVKNHAFLIHACARLRDSGLNFHCKIAGAGPEHQHLSLLIRGNRLHDHVQLLGHVPAHQMTALYRTADLFVLTSLSEGIPLVLMEAMANGMLVLAPAITGIPELVVPEKSGFLYPAGDLPGFMDKILSVEALLRYAENGSAEQLNQIRQSAHQHVLDNFHRRTNLAFFANTFLQSITAHQGSPDHENFVLQQI